MFTEFDKLSENVLTRTLQLRALTTLDIISNTVLSCPTEFNLVALDTRLLHLYDLMLREIYGVKE